MKVLWIIFTVLLWYTDFDFDKLETVKIFTDQITEFDSYSHSLKYDV